MNKQIITDHLNKYDHKFEVKGEKINVKLDFNLEINIDLSSEDKIKISDRLAYLNFLSFPFSMSIKGTMLYNFFSSFLVFILFLCLKDSIDTYSLTLIVIFAAFWNLYWLFYYLIKSENFKTEIKTLLK